MIGLELFLWMELIGHELFWRGRNVGQGLFCQNSMVGPRVFFIEKFPQNPVLYFIIFDWSLRLRANFTEDLVNEADKFMVITFIHFSGRFFNVTNINIRR